MAAVEVGQIWVDNDKRVTPMRFVRIISIADGKASCMAWYDKVGSQARAVSIRLDRFRPTATGYRLATAAEASRAGA